MKDRQFGVRAVLKSGAEIQPRGCETGSGVGSPLRAENDIYGMPLNAIQKFRIDSRPIRTMEWTNVVLPPN